jgi:hypothetical protein
MVEMAEPLPRHPTDPDLYLYRGAYSHYSVILGQRRTPYAVLSEAEAAALYWWDHVYQELGIIRNMSLKRAAGPHLPEG